METIKNNIKITKTTKTNSGKVITMTGELILSRKNWLDGDVSITECCETRYDVSIEGHGSQGSYIRDGKGLNLPEGHTHLVGRLPLTQSSADLFSSIVEEIESNPEWIAKKERENKALNELVEYEKHNAAVNKMMSL